MQIVTAREFRSNQGKFLGAAKRGQDVLLTSRYGNFRIIPITEDDALMSKEEYFAKIEKSISEVRKGKTYAMKQEESLENFLDRMEEEGHV